MATGEMRHALAWLVSLFTVALILNLLWENAQMPLYQSFGSPAQHFSICARASLWDAGYITVLYLVLALAHKDFFWVRQRTAVNYLFVIIVSLLVAWWIEFDALRDGRWAYREQMPLVFGTGLTPLLQLPLLSLLAYGISRRLPFISFTAP